MTYGDTGYEDSETGPGLESGRDSGGFIVQNNHEQSLPADSVEKELATWKLMGDPRQVYQRQKECLKQMQRKPVF